eukprot:scaffold43752_cov51-Attheya_sp.AAC.4
MVAQKIGYTVQVAVLGLTGVLVSSGGISRESNAAQQNSEARVTVVASVSNNKSIVSSLPSRPIVPIPMDLECIELSVSTDSGDEIDEVKTIKGTNGTSHLAIWSNTEEALQDGSTISLETKFRKKGKNRAKKIQVSVRLMRGDELITVGVSTVRVPGPTFPSMMMDVPIVSTPGSSLTARFFGRNRKEGENHVDRSTASLRSVSFTEDPYRRYELEKDATLRVQIEAIPTTEYEEKTSGSKVTGSAQKQEVGVLLQTPSSDSGVSSISHTIYSGDEDSIATTETNERDTKFSPLNLASSPKSQNAVGGKPPMSDILLSVMSPKFKSPPLTPFSAQGSVKSKKMNASPAPSKFFGDAVSPTTAGNFQSILVPASEQTGEMKEDMLKRAIETLFPASPRSLNLDKLFVSPKSGIHHHDSEHQENHKESIRRTSSKQSNSVGQRDIVSKTTSIDNNFEHVNDDDSTGSTVSTLTNPKIQWNNKKQAGSYGSNSFEDENGNGKSERMSEKNIEDSLVKAIMSQFFCTAPNLSAFDKRKDARKEAVMVDRKEGKLPVIVNASDDEVSVGELTQATVEQMELSAKIHEKFPVSFGGKGLCSSMPQGDNMASHGSPAMIRASSRFLPKTLNGDHTNSGRQTSKNHEHSNNEISIFSAAFQSGVDAARSKLVDLGEKLRESAIDDDYSVSTTESNCENRDDVSFKSLEKRPVDHSSIPPRREGPLSTRPQSSNLRREGGEREGNSSQQGKDNVRSSSRKSAGFKRREQDSFNAPRENVPEELSHDDEASNDTFSLMSDEENNSDDSYVAESQEDDVPSRSAESVARSATASVARSAMTFTV